MDLCLSNISISCTWENLRIKEPRCYSSIILTWLWSALKSCSCVCFFLAFQAKFWMSETLGLDVKKLRKKVKRFHWFHFLLKNPAFSKLKGYHWDLLLLLWACKDWLFFREKKKKGTPKHLVLCLNQYLLHFRLYRGC